MDMIQKLQMVQNRAARLVTRTRKYEHITPVLKRLHWLPVKVRIEFKLLLLVYKALHGLAPSYLRDLLTEYQPSRSLRSSSLKMLLVPRTKLKTFGDRAFSISGPKLWNDLPLDIRTSESIGTFKSRLKTHFFTQSYDL